MAYPLWQKCLDMSSLEMAFVRNPGDGVSTKGQAGGPFGVCHDRLHFFPPIILSWASLHWAIGWRVELGQLRTCSGKKPLGEKRSCISVHFCTTWKSVFAVQEEQAKWPPIICSWVALLHAPHAPYTRSSSSSPCINYVKDYSAAADDSWHHLLLLLFMHSQEDQLDPDTPPPIADTLCWFFGSINWVLIKIHHVPPSAYLLKLTSEFQIVSFLAPMIFQLIC